MSDFVHLHVHTQYSLLDGLSRLEDLTSKVKEHGQTAVAITDHGAMYGTVHFYNACKKAGIKPIIGLEAYMSEKGMTTKQAKMGADQYHLTLLAKDNDGYRNLLSLTSIANLEGFSYKPRIDFDLLSKHSQGLICTSGCASSIINKKIRDNKTEEAIKWIKKFQKLFKDDFYIEIQRHPNMDWLEELTKTQIKLAKQFGIPLVATNDVHYVEKDDAEAQDALLAIQTRKIISDKNRMSMLDTPDYYLKSSQEMIDAFAEYPESIENTVKIAEKCNVEIQTGKMIFPNYPLKKGQSESDALREMTYSQAKQRFANITPEITQRLDYELDIIKDKGYSSYFLIVQDFVNWAKDHDIGVGPGRGSAAGSLVSYVLRITDIDPLKHDLAFERFLNPQRPSPPDIDIDIADVKRDDVIRYTADAYGEDHVAQVITFGTMEARAAIRDIGRVLGMPYAEPDMIAKLIPQGTKLKKAIETVPELQEHYKNPRYKKLLDLAQKVEGIARHHSVHAAAVVIADKPLSNYTAVQRETKGGKIVTQYDMYALDLNVDENAIGILKMDFLGLRNLSILSEAIKFVKQEKDIKIELTDIPLDEEKVFQTLSEGETTGVFQLESMGMRRVARNLQPSKFSDITAMVALYRPGPMDLIDDFIAGKKDETKIQYPHEDLKPILKETYGIPVYQEQVLQIANVFAGYTLGEADILRRAIGKKKKYILDKEKKRFVEGAAEKGYTKEKAIEIWGFIEKFAGYGFNKAHSASYAMIAYHTAWMKVMYPVEYMAALLSIESVSHSANRDEKITQAIDECRRMGIKVLPPEINHSSVGFTIEKDSSSLDGRAIRYGLSAVKNVGEAAVESIVETRTESGEFHSVTDFVTRVDGRKANKKVLESLILVGSFDKFGSRSAIVESLEELRSKAQAAQKQRDTGQSSLFAGVKEASITKQKDKLVDVPEFPLRQKLSYEKKLLGVYVSDNPIAAALRKVDKTGAFPIGNLDASFKNQKTLVGVITSFRQVLTKASNKEMAFATLSDETGSIDLVLFPKIYATIKHGLEEDKLVKVTGTVDQRDDQINILANSLEFIDESAEQQTSMLQKDILIPRGTDKKVLKEIGALLKARPGADTVTIIIPNGHAPKRITLPYTVNLDESLRQKIDALLK